MPEPAAKSPNDVAKPGTTAPSATSKPVIVGHTSTVQDPMVSEPAAQPAKEPATQTSGGSSKPKIMPTTDADDLKKQATTEEDKQHAEALPVDEKKEEIPDYQARLGELIESGEYNVSIKPVGGNLKTFALTVVTIVLLGLIVGYILIDLNVIDVGIKLPFELFK